MRYFVFAEDGNKYGPADVGMLNRWIEEGRLLPAMMLEEEGTLHRVAAASIAGLDFYVLDEDQQPIEAASASAAVAVMAIEPSPTEALSFDLVLAWLSVVATLAFAAVRGAAGYLAIFTTLLGIMASLKAKEKGHFAAGPAIVINVLAFVVWLAARLYLAMK